MAAVNVSTMGLDDLIGREWLSVNHVGGFACSTLAGLNTRKYHGLLIASMAPPVRRMVLLSRVEETVRAGTNEFELACSEYPGTIYPQGYQYLRAFSTDPFPRWAYQGDGWTLEKSVRLISGENTVCLTYTLLGAAKPVALEIRPLFALRPIHELTFQWNARLDAQRDPRGFYRIPPTTRTPEVFFACDGTFAPLGDWYKSTIYRREEERGYAGLEDLWTPGLVRWTLQPGQSVHVACSSEPLELERVIAQVQRPRAEPVIPIVPSEARNATLETLTRAAGQFSVTAGQVVTQYPWSPPSVREALISVPGLFLITHRFHEARELLTSLPAHIRDGLLPSDFPEDGAEPLYQGADVSLWFVNAVHAYLRYTSDTRTASQLLEPIVKILRSYQAGTSLGIGIDGDGLLLSHEPGLGTTWMDGKVGDWVITPRQGRAVELNALWFNALRIAESLCERFDRPDWATEFARLAGSVKLAFNRRFWNELAGCCFDVVGEHGADPSVRPNQLFAISLPFPVLDPQRWAPLLDKVRAELLTPLGLRTLSPHDPSYIGQYGGDVVSRERASHQGTTYPWLLGAYVSAHARTFHPSPHGRRAIMSCIDACAQYVQGDGMGHLCELFDGDEPQRAGGAIASARSVAEVLRCYVEDVLNLSPGPSPSRDASQNPHLESSVDVERTTL